MAKCYYVRWWIKHYIAAIYFLFIGLSNTGASAGNRFRLECVRCHNKSYFLLSALVGSSTLCAWRWNWGLKGSPCVVQNFMTRCVRCRNFVLVRRGRNGDTAVMGRLLWTTACVCMWALKLWRNLSGLSKDKSIVITAQIPQSEYKRLPPFKIKERENIPQMQIAFLCRRSALVWIIIHQSFVAMFR